MLIHRTFSTLSVGMLAAFLTMIVTTGCSGSHNGIVTASTGCGAGQAGGFLVLGSVSGLVGSGGVIQTDTNLTGFPVASTFLSMNGTDQLLVNLDCNSPYNLTVSTQPTSPAQTCVIENGSGPGGTTSIDNVVVTCTTNPPRFAYVVNRGSNNVSAYALDASTGTLAPLAGSPFAAGNLPVAIAVDQGGRYLYVVNQTDATISAFLIDRSSGGLTSVSGSPRPSRSIHRVLWST